MTTHLATVCLVTSYAIFHFHVLPLSHIWSYGLTHLALASFVISIIQNDVASCLALLNTMHNQTVSYCHKSAVAHEMIALKLTAEAVVSLLM